MASQPAPTALSAPPLPWRLDADGALRIGGTRVTLYTVIAAFNAGCCAEEIVFRYPTLKLADVYAVIAYYLCHQPEINGFMEEERRQSEELRLEIEAAMPPDRNLRARLLARRGEP